MGTELNGQNSQNGLKGQKRLKLVDFDAKNKGLIKFSILKLSKIDFFQNP
jgi:hypothetical protein